MFTYRGREVSLEITGAFTMGGKVQRIKRSHADIDFHQLTAASEEEICDKIDEMLGPPPATQP